MSRLLVGGFPLPVNPPHNKDIPMKLIKAFTILLAALFASGAVAHAADDTYTIDPVHSSVLFKVRHFFNPVTGKFGKFEGTVTYDEANPSKNKAQATIEISSVSTLNDSRDAHLQRDDFFNAAQFPTITYESTSWKRTGDKTYQVEGKLTFHGKTNPVVLEVKVLGSGEGVGNKAGKTVIGFSGKGKINRSDWGVNGASPVVGDEVEIELSIQAQK